MNVYIVYECACMRSCVCICVYMGVMCGIVVTRVCDILYERMIVSICKTVFDILHEFLLNISGSHTNKC